MVVLGISLFVLGFALGPLIWAPFSEVLGRRPLFIYTYAALTAFSAGCALAPNMTALIVLRFFAGAFGSSPLTNAGGNISDLFNANQRGLAMSMFAAAPFMGPVIGPIVGGFTGMTVGWRWVMWVMCIFSGAVLLVGSLLLPETYAPVLLRKRAAKLSKMTGKVRYTCFLQHCATCFAMHGTLLVLLGGNREPQGSAQSRGLPLAGAAAVPALALLRGKPPRGTDGFQR